MVDRTPGMDMKRNLVLPKSLGGGTGRSSGAPAQTEPVRTAVEQAVQTVPKRIGQRVGPGPQWRPPEDEGRGSTGGGAGENVARIVNAESDPADREHRSRDQGEDPPATLSQQDRDGDRERRGRMVAGKTWVRGVGGEEMYAMGIGDKRPRPVDQFRDDLGDRESQPGAEYGGHRRPAPGQVPGAMSAEKDDHQGGEEECLGCFNVEEQRILEPIVGSHEVVVHVHPEVNAAVTVEVVPQ